VSRGDGSLLPRRFPASPKSLASSHPTTARARATRRLYLSTASFPSAALELHTHATNYYYFHPDLHQPPSPVHSHAAAGTTLVVPTTTRPSNTPRDLPTFHDSIPPAHRSLCWQRGRIPRYLTFASRSKAQQKASCFQLPGPAIPPARTISSTHSLPRRHM
jgi:hypothetical protein